MGEREQHIRTVEVSAIDLETLRFLHNKGPVWDGDLPSKAARDSLLSKDLIAKVVHQGEEGYQACTYRGRALLRAIQDEIGGVKFDD